MEYDIYGNNLAHGHCEVHPQVAESYPCSLCYAEANNSKHGKQRHQLDPEAEYYAKMEREYYEDMERAHYDEIARKNSWLYRVLCYVAPKVDFINEWVKKRKEKVFSRAVADIYQK